MGGKRPRIYQRIILFQFISIVAVMSLYGFISYKISFAREVQLMKSETDLLAKRLASNLAIPLWNLDRKSADNLLMQEVRNLYLSGIAVVESGRLWLGKLKTDNGEIQSIDAASKDWESNFGRSQETREKIAYTDRKGIVWDLGELTLYTTDKTIDAALLALLRQTVLQSLILVVTLSVITVLVLNLLLNKPLRGITRTAQRISSGELGLQAEVAGPREIATLAAAFNTMTGQLRESMETLEERVSQRTAELKAMNEQLEAFAYSIAHDLRAPLRAINGYTHLIAERYGDTFDAEGKRVLTIVQTETSRMDKLITRLLEFSRIGRSSLKPAPVDMADMARAAFEKITGSRGRGGIEFRVGELPAAIGDPALLLLVWMNLLSNAIKFSARSERATISVEGVLRTDEIVYSVRDNGAGFDMRYANKLFAVFQRLHSAGDFEGNGIGLALVQRIVSMHGGRVWAEGEVGKGAVFSFSLPRGVRGRREA